MDTEKRFILAVVLCVAIFFIFSSTGNRSQPKPEPTGTPSASETTDPGTTPSGSNPQSSDAGSGAGDGTSSSNVAAADPSLTFEHQPSIPLKTEFLDLTLSTRGACVTHARLTEYKEDDLTSDLTLFSPELESAGAFKLRLDEPGAIRLDTLDWDLVAQSEGSVTFQYPLEGGLLKKTIQVLPDQPYLLDVSVEWTGSAPLRYLILGPARLRYDMGARQPNQEVTGYGTTQFDSVARVPVALVPGGRVDEARQDILWSGLGSNYFTTVMRPVEIPERSRVVIGTGDTAAEDQASARNGKGIQAYPYHVGFKTAVPGGGSQRFEAFIGPKAPELLARYEDRGYTELVYYGDYLGGLVRGFLWLMRFFQGLIGSWGIAIVLLTLVVKLLLHPINKRNQGMMQRQSIRMKELQPKMDKLKEQHKNDPTRATREIQQLLRDENVNPLALFGGCMLIFLQLPIWIALISTFTMALELRQQSFLYIVDLTQADHLFQLPFTIPWLGGYFNLLPILYVILTLVNQKMMPKAADAQMAQQQKMMTFMMVAFGFIFYNFSSGLLIYFITSAAIGILEQRIIRAELRREGVVPATS
ncbi:MAG: YidC/Oxa1 family insertase periplasmic-domain containing protein [Planctomycetota bacterium]